MAIKDVLFVDYTAGLSAILCQEEFAAIND